MPDTGDFWAQLPSPGVTIVLAAGSDAILAGCGDDDGDESRIPAGAVFTLNAEPGTTPKASSSSTC